MQNFRIQFTACKQGANVNRVAEIEAPTLEAAELCLRETCEAEDLDRVIVRRAIVIH